jgi:hypothetical protein
LERNDRIAAFSTNESNLPTSHAPVQISGASRQPNIYPRPAQWRHVFGVTMPQLTCKTLVPVGQQPAVALLYTKKLKGDPTVHRSVILIAGAGVALEGGLRLPPGYYRAVKRRIEGSTPSKRQLTDPEYLIELSGRQIVAMGGSLGAAGLISADVDVTRQVREVIISRARRFSAGTKVLQSR